MKIYFFVFIILLNTGKLVAMSCSDIFTYNSVYETVQRLGGEGARFYPREPSNALITFLNTSGLNPGLAVILGSGEGRNIDPLVERHWQIVGVDSAEAGIRRAELDHKDNPTVSLYTANVLEPLDRVVAPGSADLVIGIQLVHMFIRAEDRLALFQNVWRLLRPGGFAFFETNGEFEAGSIRYLNLDSPVESRTLHRADGSTMKMDIPRFPTVMLNGETLRSEIERSGLIVESMRGGSFRHPDTTRPQILAIVRKPDRPR